MTERPSGDDQVPPRYPPPPGYDSPDWGTPSWAPNEWGQHAQFPPPVYPAPGPLPGYYFDPVAPYGRHPFTGEPLSDKSKLVAGLLQLIGLFGVLGIGRLYLGYTGLGIAQLVIGIVGGLIIGLLTCGVGFLIPVVWAVIDAVLILTDRVRDPQGRPLRDG